MEKQAFILVEELRKKGLICGIVALDFQRQNNNNSLQKGAIFRLKKLRVMFFGNLISTIKKEL